MAATGEKVIDNIMTWGDVESAVFWAPKGTPHPDSLKGDINSAFENVGWLTEDGVSMELSVESTKVKAWQGGTAVLYPIQGTERKISFTAMEDSVLVNKLYHGITEKGTATDTKKALKLTVPGGVQSVDGAVIIYTKAGEYEKLTICPNVSITERGGTAYKFTDATTYPLTMAIRGDHYVISNHPDWVKTAKTL